MHAVSKKIVQKAERFGADRDKIDVIYSSLDFRSAREFKFISPGIFINEKHLSELFTY